jgi:hypothetical protein
MRDGPDDAVAWRVPCSSVGSTNLIPCLAFRSVNLEDSLPGSTLENVATGRATHRLKVPSPYRSDVGGRTARWRCHLASSHVRHVRLADGRGSWALHWFAGLALLLVGIGSVAADAGGQRLNTARSVLDLNIEAGHEGIPTRIRGVVTCSSERASLFFVQDETAGIYVYLTGVLPPQGTLVEVEGVSARGLFSPIVSAGGLAQFGRAPLPAARSVAIEDLASGRHDSQWIEVEGVVIRQEENWGHQLLTLASGSARLEVRVLEPASAASTNWVDARVRIQGVAGTTYNDRRQLTGFHLLVQTAASIRVLRPAPEDLFDLPLRKSGSLLCMIRKAPPNIGRDCAGS